MLAAVIFLSMFPEEKSCIFCTVWFTESFDLYYCLDRMVQQLVEEAGLRLNQYKGRF